MKTKDLIKLLMEEDPTGEIECCINNCDIEEICWEVAYYDGCLQTVKRDEDGIPISGEYISSGKKINIYFRGILDIIKYNPEFPVIFSEYSKRKYEDKVENARIQGRELQIKRKEWYKEKND